MNKINSANKAQREVILQLFEAIFKMPERSDCEAYELYQREVMQPLRDEIQRLKTVS